MSAKIGRPTDDPKVFKLGVRINSKSKQILDDYCLQENVSKTEAIERGIAKLENDIKK